MKLDLQLFGGHGGSSIPMDAFFKQAARGAKKAERDAADEDKGKHADATFELKAAKSVMGMLNRAKDERRMEEKNNGFYDDWESNVLNGWADKSSVAKYDSEEYRLTIEKGKMAQARREFEKYVRKTYQRYYRKGRPPKKK